MLNYYIKSLFIFWLHIYNKRKCISFYINKSLSLIYYMFIFSNETNSIKLYSITAILRLFIDLGKCHRNDLSINF